MNPPERHPAALEAAFLEFRRMDNRAAERFLAALREEEQQCLTAVLAADSPFMQNQAVGAASMARTLVARLAQAEQTLARDAAIAAGNHNRTTKGTPL